jgi:hypothetical protein
MRTSVFSICSSSFHVFALSDNLKIAPSIVKTVAVNVINDDLSAVLWTHD